MFPTPQKFIERFRKSDPEDNYVSDLIELARMVKDGELVLRSDLTEKDNAA